MKLAVNELEKLFQLTLQYFCDEKIQKIRFENDDYYPKVWRKDIKFDDPVFMKCPDFVMGSLDDDIEELKYVLKDRYIFFGLHMEKLGALLNILGALLEEDRYLLTDGGMRRPELSVKQLTVLFEVMVSYIKAQNIEEIFFEKKNDWYFRIPHEKINFDEGSFLDCLPYTLESLVANIADLKKVLDGEVKMDGVYLQKLGAVLTAMGETI